MAMSRIKSQCGLADHDAQDGFKHIIDECLYMYLALHDGVEINAASDTALRSGAVPAHRGAVRFLGKSKM